ncbi:hypothetical protein ACP4OV_022628 [Aristida adscensionis]
MHRRRFVNMVVDSTSSAGDHRAYALHRINVADLFHRGRGRCQHAADDMETEDAVLPQPAMVLRPAGAGSDGDVEFLPLAGSDDGEAVAINSNGRAMLCAAAARTVHVLPDLRGLAGRFTRRPFSLTVGDGLYVIDREWLSSAAPGRGSFQVLTGGGGSAVDLRRRLPAGTLWQWRTLPPPPWATGGRGHSWSIEACAVVGGSEIWVTVAEGHDETYSFDSATGAWRKVGDWALPFMGRAEYVPEHGLWFGLSSASGGWDSDRLLTVHASDLTPGGDVWKWQGLAVSSDELSAEHEDSYLVPLGQRRLCVARFEEDYDDGMCVMLSGVEVVRDTGAKCGLRMLLHRAKRYTLLGKVSRRFCRVF